MCCPDSADRSNLFVSSVYGVVFELNTFCISSRFLSSKVSINACVSALVAKRLAGKSYVQIKYKSVSYFSLVLLSHRHSSKQNTFVVYPLLYTASGIICNASSTPVFWIRVSVHIFLCNLEGHILTLHKFCTADKEKCESRKMMGGIVYPKEEDGAVPLDQAQKIV
jgi:hypothetical protein